MEAYQQRVVDEKRELDEKLAALRVFLQGQTYANLNAHERNLLYKQAGVMAEYSRILGERIAAFQGTSDAIGR
jgi:hypothetical protein